MSQIRIIDNGIMHVAQSTKCFWGGVSRLLAWLV